jgi:tetratricopeptide (TPR) repeat protein
VTSVRRRGILALAMTIAVAPCLRGTAAARAAGREVAQAEAMAQQALGQCGAGSSAAGEALARKALALTAEFEPTDFVTAGRKGEVVEDEFLAARQSYRAHRAIAYEAVGSCLAASGQHRAAARYLGRAVLLKASPARSLALARALIAQERAGEALLALKPLARSADPEWLRLLQQAVDAARLPSAQLEIDRWRLEPLAPGVTPVSGPLRLAAEPRLSTGAPYAFGAEPVVLYVATTACRECSGHLQGIQEALRARRGGSRDAPLVEVRVLMVPEEPDQDHALRQVLTLYRYPWPVLLGRGHPASLGVKPGSVLVVARNGWSGALVQPPFSETLTRAIETLSQQDLTEALPRGNWNRRPPERVVPKAAALLPEGLAPGEDEPAPAAFTAAVDAYRAKQGIQALRFLDALAADAGGWLLPPEARFNRALALSAAGDRAAARRILLRIGDSRFQDEVDRALESLPAR